MATDISKKQQLPVRFVGDDVALYDKLRKEAFDKKTSMNEIILEQIRKRYHKHG